MRVRGWAVAAITAVALAVSGCGGGDPADPDRPVVDDPQAHTALTRALDFIATTPFETYLNMGPDVAAAGYMDVTGRSAQVATVLTKGGTSTKVQIRLVGGQTYLKIEGVSVTGVGDRWARLDPAKIPDGFVMGFETGRNDPSGGARVLGGVTAVERTGTGFRGTVDLTHTGKGNGISLRPEQLAALDDGGTRVPFEATVDAQGRITQLRLTLASGDTILPVQVRYSEFGKQSAVQAPTGDQVIDAPADLYTRLGT